MTELDHDAALGRRNLIRGGAVLAGAAGLSALGAAIAPTKASAANGDDILQGSTTTGTTTTSIELTSGAANTTPTLRLTNANGPTLQLTPVDTAPTGLQVGQFVATDEGPYVGLSDGTNTGTGFLATNFDIDNLAVPVPLAAPERIVYTGGTAAQRARIVRTSTTPPSAAFDSAGRLKAGAWMDVAVDQVNADFVVDGAFFSLVAVNPAANGYLTAYPPSATVPGTSAVTFRTGVSLGNGVFIGVGLYLDNYVVRIRTSAVTHVVFDLTGLTLKGPTAELPGTTRSNARRKPASRRLQRTYKRKNF